MVDGAPWKATFSDMVTDPVFSPDGRRVAVLARDGARWKVVVDDNVWDRDFDMAYPPVFDPHSRHVAAKVEIGAKFTIAVDGKVWDRSCDMVWDPCFSAAGDKLLVRSLEDGVYHRRVLPLDAIIR